MKLTKHKSTSYHYIVEDTHDDSDYWSLSVSLPTKEDIKKWITALRSGRYTQGMHQLETIQIRTDTNIVLNCCLGVGCREFIPIDKLRLNSTGSVAGSFPGGQVASPEWLKHINGVIDILINKPLSSLNDEARYTFDEIADVLYLVFLTDAFYLIQEE